MNPRVARTRFVAGAECTYCHTPDRMMIDLDAEGVLLARRCLACGKEEAMGEGQEDKPAPAEPLAPIRTRQLD